MLWLFMREEKARPGEVQGMVIRADDEARARELAVTRVGDEGPEPWRSVYCQPLSSAGPDGVALRVVARWA